MESKDLKEAIGKPHVLRLKQLGAGIMVGKVLGSRVLVKTVTPRTDLDRVEEQGLIQIPKWVKKENTPLPTTGVVIQLGPEVPAGVISEGDMVMFPKFSGSDFAIENEDLRILEAAEILCTLVDTQQVLTEVKEDGI